MKLAEYYKILHCLPSCTGNEAKLKQGEYTSTVLVTRERTGIRQTWVKGRGRREKGERERERALFLLVKKRMKILHSRRISWNINKRGPMLFLYRLSNFRHF